MSIKNLKKKSPALNFSVFIVLKYNKIFSAQIILLRIIVYETNHYHDYITRIKLIILYVEIYAGYYYTS